MNFETPQENTPDYKPNQEITDEAHAAIDETIASLDERISPDLHAVPLPEEHAKLVEAAGAEIARQSEEDRRLAIERSNEEERREKIEPVN